MCGKTGADNLLTSPAKIPIPALSTFSLLDSKRVCIPTQIPNIGLVFSTRSEIKSTAPISSNCFMQAANAPTPGITSADASRQTLRSFVTTTFFAAISNARCADRKLPEP